MYIKKECIVNENAIFTYHCNKHCVRVKLMFWSCDHIVSSWKSLKISVCVCLYIYIYIYIYTHNFFSVIKESV